MTNSPSVSPSPINMPGSDTLPSLRRDLDIMPSPVEDRPGVLLRDPMRYSEAVIIVPWVLARCLDLFDGEHNALDLRQSLVEETGELDVSGIQDQLVGALGQSGFLEDDTFAAAKLVREREFGAAPVREATHAGSAYPEELPALKTTMQGYIDPASLDGNSSLVAIAAPHVSPFGGWESYQAAYRQLPRDAHDRTFVILGTSHYGAPDKFGLTRKSFETPLGRTRPNLAMLDRLSARAPQAITEEDYCHSVEHSIEFQVLFLQWLYGPDIEVVPILCGSFARSLYFGGKPEENDQVARFLGELGEISAAGRDQLTWVLGIDMAHIGRRYGDADPARANEGYLLEVAARDRLRNERVIAGDAAGFWDLVQQNRDDLRWCGSAPLYTFLKALPGVRGRVHRYEQWNIDEASVVSFAGLSFTRP